MSTVIPAQGARYFAKGFNDNHSAPALGYIYDSGVVWQPLINGQLGDLITGAWRPTVPGDLASSTTIDVSGGLSVNVGSVAVTGGQISLLNPLLATSGVIQGGNSIPVNVTGIVQTVVTGSVQSTFPNPVGVTGTKVDAATIYATNLLAPYNFVAGGGRITNPSGEGSVTGSYTTGQFTMFNFAPNGALYVNNGVLESGYDSVTASVQGGNSIPINVSGIVLTQVTGTVSATFDSASIVLAQASGNAIAVQTNALLTGVSGLLSSNLTDAAWVTGTVGVQTSATISANTVSGLATQFFGTPLVANAARKAWGIQNIGTGVLLVKLASTIPTTGNLTFVLKGATNAWVGDGAIWTDSPAVYTGPVSVTGFGGAPCVYQAWEL